jgi:hypothetical protein
MESLKYYILPTGILLLGILTSFGATYFFEGDLLFITLCTLILTVPLGLISYWMSTVKSDRKQAKTPEYILLSIYLIVATIAALFQVHGMNIEFNLKQDIKTDLTKQASEIKQMFTDYESAVNREAESYKLSLQNAGRLNTEETVQDFKKSLLDGYQALKESKTQFADESILYLKDWNKYKVSLLNKKINKEKTDLENTLRTKFKHPTVKLQELPITNNLSTTYEMNKLNKFWSKTNWLVVILLLIVGHFLVLVPYLFTQRSNSAFILDDTGNTDVPKL